VLPLASLAREPRRLSLRESYSSLRVVRRGRVGARPPQFFFFSSSVALPASIRKAESSPLSKAVASGLRIKKPDAVPVFRAGVPSHLWLGTGPPGPSLLNSSPIPVRRKLRAWDCKLTPADCACQERNTTGCIPSNDGLDAGLGTRFPHQIQAAGVRLQASGFRLRTLMLLRLPSGRLFLSFCKPRLLLLTTGSTWLGVCELIAGFCVRVRSFPDSKCSVPGCQRNWL